LSSPEQPGASATPGSGAKPIARFCARFSSPRQQAVFLKLLVVEAKATDHGATPAVWAASAFAHHNTAGPMEETSMH
jgi:hypothetical protein